MQQVVAVVAVAGLVVGGLLGGGVIDGDDDGGRPAAPVVAGGGGEPQEPQGPTGPAAGEQQIEGGGDAGQRQGAPPEQNRGRRGADGTRRGARDRGGADGAPSEQRGNAEAYCVVSNELERAGRRTFGDLERGQDPSRGQLRAAERRFVQENRQLLDLAPRFAPAAIRSDVAILVRATRARGGASGASPSRQAARRAENRVSRFERRTC